MPLQITSYKLPVLFFGTAALYYPLPPEFTVNFCMPQRSRTAEGVVNIKCLVKLSTLQDHHQCTFCSVNSSCQLQGKESYMYNVILRFRWSKVDNLTFNDSVLKYIKFS